ncbi:unnamed protein product [Spirodela intermedia]|uniref:Uncharacterized protein n=1 Tax=Spirodela intermedia TaxID=51605 RepID=A0A7I8J2N4_SPIIN|nr:unnamed protein product [Spirodela intermedia]CAA6663661.1 unnamed protein product [Spirodela intermedia]
MAVRSLERGREPVATIQICVDRRCLVFQISRAGKAPKALERFLADPSVTFVNVGIAAFQRRLQEHWELSVIRAVDLRWRASIGRASLQQMASNFLGWDTRLEDLKPPGVGLSDWEAESLDEGQIRYACLHAYTSFLLEKRFRELRGSS